MVKSDPRIDVGATLIGANLSDGRAALPLPACHQGVYARLRRAMERSEFARSSRKIPGEGPLHELRLADTPPHPDSLPASGEREQPRPSNDPISSQHALAEL